MLKRASEIKQNKRRETLLNNKDKALLSKKLVSLKEDVPIKNELNDFLIKKIDKDKLYNFLREMEFNRLLSQVISFYGEPNKNKIDKTEQPLKISEINTKLYKHILNEKDLEKFEDDPLFINGVRQDIQPEYVKKRKIELSSCLNDLLYLNDKSRQHYFIKKDYGIKGCTLPEKLKFTELKKIHNTVSLSFKCGAKYNTNDVEEFCSSRKGENTESFESCFSKKMKQTLKKSSY